MCMNDRHYFVYKNSESSQWNPLADKNVRIWASRVFEKSENSYHIFHTAQVPNSSNTDHARVA